MQVFRDYTDWPASLKGAAVAIGNFDGLHPGHRAVLKKLREQADELLIPAVVMCFEPHPRRYFQPDSPRFRLLSLADKANLIAQAGVDAMLAQRFNKAFATLSAEEFIQRVLVDALSATLVITGEEFVFGHKRGGNAQALREQSSFAYEAIAPVGNVGEGKFSSSKIREHLRQGEMALANAMLGRPYAWKRRVLHGDKRGRTIGFPTANLLPPPLLLPRRGVYAMRAKWDGGRADAVGNLGERPTVNGTQLRLEVHLLDTEVDLYGKMLNVEFVSYLRDEQRYDSLNTLQTQIAADVVQAREKLS